MKKILFFIAFFCSVMFGATAQNTDATINANYVKYWVGTGSNQAIFIVNWCEPDTALAWGFRFSEDSLLVADMLNAIATADPRFSTEGTSGWLTNLIYIDGSDTFKIALGDYVVYNHNGSYANTVDLEYFYPNDYLKFGGLDCADMDENWISTWTTSIEPVEISGVPVQDATINASEIQYWVGSGSNEALFIVNWCEPATALAWGYRFNDESVLVSTMLADIAAADPRFSYSESYGYLSDLVFVNDNGDSLTIVPDYVVYNVNGGLADAVNVQTIQAGDYVKMGGYFGCSQQGESEWVEDDYGTYWNYAYVWTTPITAVSAPTSVVNYENQKLIVYPNPCTASVRIQTNVNDDVVLYNLQGAVVMNTVAMDEITTLDVNNLPAGIYFVKSGNKTAKIVKK